MNEFIAKHGIKSRGDINLLGNKITSPSNIEIETTQDIILNGQKIPVKSTQMGKYITCDADGNWVWDDVSIRGVPAGGMSSQILSKKSMDDYDCEWIDNLNIDYNVIDYTINPDDWDVNTRKVIINLPFDNNPLKITLMGLSTTMSELEIDQLILSNIIVVNQTTTTMTLKSYGATLPTFPVTITFGVFI